MTLLGWVLVMLCSCLTAIGNLLMRSGVTRAGGFEFGGLSELPAALLRLASQPLFALGVILYGLASLVWFRVIASEPLSTAYPILVSLTFVVVTFGAVVLFRESFDLRKVLALVLILAGIYIMGRQ